jgi:hypothetical protein
MVCWIFQGQKYKVRYKTLIGNPKSKGSLSRPKRRPRRKIILKWILEKCGVKIWVGNLLV